MIVQLARISILILLPMLTMQSAFSRQGADSSDKRLEFFEAKIRPVLIRHCYECHNSVDAAEGEFALDHREPLLKGGAGGVAITVGDPANSRFMQIIKHQVAGLEMPEGGDRLPDSVIADFEEWIADGAFDPRDHAPTDEELSEVTSWDAIREKRKEWWSFQPIRDYPIPDAIDNNSSQNPIDRFIDLRLSKAGLKASPKASAETLVRRTYFALTGLPPTYDESQSWLEKLEGGSDRERQAAFVSMVDSLLESPRFGERWARHWMDWIRYAESHGSEGDPKIEQAWLYRDYLIRALNDDIPIYQLILEHIAGDLLESPRVNPESGYVESLIGPAHFRMVFHGFAPTDALDERVRFTDDQINAVSKAFLGLTVSCARCHDHKFDPISQADYYALFGILASCRPGRTAVDINSLTPENLSVLEQCKRDVRNSLAASWKQSVERWSEKDLNDAFSKATLDPIWPSVSEDALDHYWDLADPQHYQQWYRTGVGLPEEPQRAGEIRLAETGELVVQAVLPAGVSANALSTKLPARLTSPDFVLKPDEKMELWVLARGGGGATVRYVVQDYPRNGTVYPVRELTNDWSWHKFDLTYWAGDTLHVEITTAKDAPLLVRGEERSWFDVRYCVVAEQGSFAPEEPGKSEQSAINSQAKQEPRIDAIKDCVLELIEAWQSQQLSDKQALLLEQMVLSGYLPNRSDDASELTAKLRAFRSLEQDVPIPTRVPSLEETVGKSQPLFIRGNHKQPDAFVPRRFLEAIDDTPYDTPQSGRLEFAKDLLSKDNPLTRRVLVNRIWHHLFGKGLVATPDNFGRVGDKPSHPELLDWLAVQIEQDGWSLKSMIRRIVSSEAWQRDVTSDDKTTNLDPENRLLARQNVRRLEAECIRDSMLFHAGQLELTTGGPPVAGSLPRRSVYVNVIRNNLDPFLRVFDFPEPFSTVGRRDNTNVPAQSLTLMNDPLVKRTADAFAKRAIEKSAADSDQERVQWMMQQAFQRSIKEGEVRLALQHLKETRLHYEQINEQYQQIRRQLASFKSDIDKLQNSVRERLLSEIEAHQGEETIEPLPQPLMAWDFDNDDGLKLFKGAAIKDGALVVDGGYALTEPLTTDLTEKTIEVVVELDSLEQQGGGAMTVQTANGVTFDAIVFGERDPMQWLAGSNSFARTQSFSGARETEGNSLPVHVAITYHADGRIVGYRNGQPYGKPYVSNGPQVFSAGKTVIGFGIRHLPAGGNRLLRGKIYRAGIYNRALSEAEVLALAKSSGPIISQSQIEAAMSDEQLEHLHNLTDEIQRLENNLKALGPDAGKTNDTAAWSELAHALFTLKEFIYVR